MLPPACAQGADLHDNTHIPTSSFGLPAGVSAGPGKKFPRFSGVGLSLPCALRVAFMAAHRAGSSSLPRSPRQVAVGPLRRRSGRVPTPGSQTRLPAPQPRTHTSAFSRTAAFSVTSLGAGYARGSGLRLAVTSGAFAAVPTRQGLPLRGRGQRRDARGPRVRPGALPARGLP